MGFPTVYVREGMNALIEHIKKPRALDPEIISKMRGHVVRQLLLSYYHSHRIVPKCSYPPEYDSIPEATHLVDFLTIRIQSLCTVMLSLVDDSATCNEVSRLLEGTHRPFPEWPVLNVHDVIREALEIIYTTSPGAYEALQSDAFAHATEE
eukprot:1723624-Amphidinium_carterae.1